MTSWIQFKQSYAYSSDTANGARNKSADGSTFESIYDSGSPLVVPDGAVNANIGVIKSNIWWTTFNISSTLGSIGQGNNIMYVEAPDTVDVTTSYVITIPDGLYDLPRLNNTVQQLLANEGAKVSPDPVLALLADTATQKVVIQFNYDDVEVDFTPGDTFRDIVGWTAVNVGPFTPVPHFESAPNVAAFNTITSFRINSDIVQSGLLFNGQFSQTLATVQIDVPPGSLINFDPQNVTRISANQLSQRAVIRHWLTDDNGDLVDTASENWSYELELSYWLKVK